MSFVVTPIINFHQQSLTLISSTQFGHTSKVILVFASFHDVQRKDILNGSTESENIPGCSADATVLGINSQGKENKIQKMSIQR